MSPLEPFANQTIVDESSTKEILTSILEIRKSIPSKYFNPSIKKSLQYVAWDLMIVSMLFLTYYQLNSINFIPLIIKNFILLPLYTFAQGTIFWAIFVLGHDCGHGSFSRYPLLNDITGTFLHTLILVPYTTWKLSHRHHHKNTGNIDKDEVFHPVRKFESYKMTNGKKDNIMIPYFGLGLGWLIYLIQGYGPRAVSHINPFHPLFHKNRLGATISILSVFIALSFLFYLSKIFGIFSIVKYYFLPWIVFASWLVITTFLHHHGIEDDLKLPWFSNDQWNYVVGNLSSVDRDYGILHDVTHTIGTHQVHHLFPAIPHYYLKEATSSFRQRFPQFIRESKEPIMKTFINMFLVWKSQYLVDDDTKIFVYQKEKKQ
ncbi:omega-3 fatty acid desaturase [Glomus cerebriforme]|uniref:Omega-3 fatty acid desaturase n=1 Tax=Glomus cerebriforme TaxID=658196 RepID=A0A397SWT8_9GLOM|nr:omega-3 fatty acid desaturase [Glomus cerebriforme]